MDGEDPTKLPRDPYEQVLDSGDVVSLTFLPLNESAAIDRVRDDRCGAIVAFVGTTRDNFQGKKVTYLAYESYAPLALKTMGRIVEEARGEFTQRLIDAEIEGSKGCHHHHHPSPDKTKQSHEDHLETDNNLKEARTGEIDDSSPITSPNLHISLTHRLGPVPPSTSSILVAVSTAHRRMAFEICEWILERTKERAQIWKREVYEGMNGKEDVGNVGWKENFPVHAS